MVRKGWKGAWSCLILALGVWGFGFAQVSAPNDCNQYGFVKNENGLTIYPSVVDTALEEMDLPKRVFYTDKDLRQSARFLMQYCCEGDSSQLGCDDIQSGQHNYYPESPLILDHLVNVGMRKLDGIAEHCDALGIDCETTSEYQIKAVERREKIREIAEDTDGYPPLQIEGEFKDYWGTTETFNEQKTLLANAYFTMCDEAVNIRNAIGNNQQNTDTSLTDGKTLLQVCYEMVRVRYSLELQYVRTLMVEKGLQYLTNNMRSYMFEYFTENRMADLMDKYNKLYSCFVMVLRYAERTKCCNE